MPQKLLHFHRLVSRCLQEIPHVPYCVPHIGKQGWTDGHKESIVVDVNEPVEKRASSAVVQENKVVYMQSFSVWSLKQSLKFLTSSQFYLNILAESVYCTVFFIYIMHLWSWRIRTCFWMQNYYFFLLSSHWVVNMLRLFLLSVTLYFMLLSSYHLTPKFTSCAQNDCEYCMLE